MADDALRDILGISDGAKPQATIFVFEFRQIDGVMNFMDEDRQVSFIGLHQGAIVPQWAVADDAGPGIEIIICVGCLLKLGAVAFFAGFGGDEEALGIERHSGCAVGGDDEVQETDGIVGQGVAIGVVMAADTNDKPLGVGRIVIGSLEPEPLRDPKPVANVYV